MGCGVPKREDTGKFVTFEEFNERVKAGQKLLMFEDKVLDVTNFAEFHPGGSELIKSMLGSEIARFFLGGFKIPGVSLHVHSEKAIERLQSLVVGEIKFPLSERIFYPYDTGPLSEYWHLHSSVEVTKKHNQFEFRREGLRCAAILPYFDHCGRYFSIKCLENGMTRIYSAHFSLSTTIFPQLMKLVEAFEQKAEWSPHFPDIHNCYKDGIELIIKKLYNFSEYIHEIPHHGGKENNRFEIKGLFGQGINLDPNEDGLVVGIVCGTAVLMFADLVAYILRKNLYRKGKEMGKNYKLFTNEEFDRLGENFKFVLFSSFQKEEHSVGHELFSSTERITANCGFHNFEYIYRVSETGKPRWDTSLYKEKININATKIILCGPLGVEREVKDSLYSIGFKDTQILVL